MCSWNAKDTRFVWILLLTNLHKPSFDWLKLNHMTNWASQYIAAKSDCLQVFEVSTIMVLWKQGTA